MHEAVGDSKEEKEKSLFSRKRLPAKPVSGRAAICLDQMRGERTGKRHQQSETLGQKYRQLKQRKKSVKNKIKQVNDSNDF